MRPPILGCQTNDVEGERQENLWRGCQLNVENIVMMPSSDPLARTFPSGENSKAATDSSSPVMVVSRSYRRVDMGVKGKALHADDPRGPLSASRTMYSISSATKRTVDKQGVRGHRF